MVQNETGRMPVAGTATREGSLGKTELPKNSQNGVNQQGRVYAASPLKRRRATKDEMEDRAAFLIEYASNHGPITVRGLYYQAEVKGVPGINKDDSSYDKVQRQVLDLRRAGRL